MIKKKYLNNNNKQKTILIIKKTSAAFVGEAAGLSALFAEKAAGSSLQEAFTSWYTDPLIRKKHRLAIDSTADMFQNLDGATGER